MTSTQQQLPHAFHSSSDPANWNVVGGVPHPRDRAYPKKGPQCKLRAFLHLGHHLINRIAANAVVLEGAELPVEHFAGSIIDRAMRHARQRRSKR